ncbi:MAG: ATP-dependent helicase HrpB [Bryobacterales bacterium]|nr:ATP-dependent helicase HrpB [Bryobacterales bacterium]
MRDRLPVDAILPELVRTLQPGCNAVLVAPPGAGKTTRVPPTLLASVGGEVLVLEPRRLAARLAARRVAAERGEPVGETVGYQVRFEEVAGPRTRLRYLTEGVLTRRLLSDFRLDGVAAVVLDEFHERHLEGDLALALLRRLQKTTRPDLRLLVMSATLEAGSVARFLGDCAVLRCEGRRYELAVRYTPATAAQLDEQVAAALSQLLREGLDGDVLVFLPGAAEIRRAMRACARLGERAGALLLPLHGDLSAEEQDHAVRPAPQRKIIFSTNVAESSVTIEGVTAVIDSGLARVASDDPWSGLPVLRLARVSRASADQRAGRAGRTRPGRVIRLYPFEDYVRRPAEERPEILRRELAQTVLQLKGMDLDPSELEWLEAPPADSLAAATKLLAHLGALDAAGRLTAIGRRMVRYPLHPRLARLLVEADCRGAGLEGAAIAARLSAGMRRSTEAREEATSDLLALREAPWDAPSRRIFEQIRGVEPLSSGHDEQALLVAALAAFPDRVARRRQGNELLLASGGSAMLSQASCVLRAEWLVAVDAEVRPDRGLPLVRLASAIRPEWLLDLFPDRLEERCRIEWNRAAERVEQTRALLYGALVLAESRGEPADVTAAATLLAEKALEAGLERFVRMAEIEAFLARVAFAAAHAALPVLTDADLRAALVELCRGCRSFAELEQAARQGGLLSALRRRLPAGAAALLDEIAPERLRLPNGRQVRVHYERHKPPWIASRLQDFFGVRETPRLVRGKVPVVVQLLAPNQRPVQTTTDLAGFWQRLYPQLRRELSRRYPKHAWPESPEAAARGD